MTQKVLETAGIAPQRLLLEWVSSAEAQRFADVATRIVNTVTELGPLDRDANVLTLEAVRRTVDSEMVRWTVGKETTLTEKGDVYGREWDPGAFKRILDTLAGTEYEKNLIYTALNHDCTSVRDIGAVTGMDLARISYLLTDMERIGLIEFKGMSDHQPKFAAI